MKRIVVCIAVVCLVGGWTVTASARNPHCAGGIQYWKQWNDDKVKGNLDDYQRELMKSIQQLEMCAKEAPEDLEAIGYLGWCYAEADSAAAAGRAFDQAIAGFTAKGEKKALERVTNNRDSYWVGAFNDGIAKIRSAQELYPEFCGKPQNPEQESQKAEASKKYEEALVSLRKAILLKSQDARAYQNIGTVHALRCEYADAEREFKLALKVGGQDAELAKALRGSLAAVRVNVATQLIDEKKYDEAIAFFDNLTSADPSNADLWVGQAEAYFKRAQSREGETRQQDFKAAGEAYAKAGAIKTEDADLSFNSALAFQNASEFTLSEVQWRNAIQRRPGDVRALSELGAVLAEQKKFDEGIRVLHQAVSAEPKDKLMHRRMGEVYTKAGNNAKATEELMVFLALDHGQAVSDPAAEAKQAPAGSQAAKTLASMGAPEAIYVWVAEGGKWQSWFYWSKNQAFHFQGGALQQKSDWNVADVKSAADGGKK